MEEQAKLLVDSGVIANKYVLLCELAINESNHIYEIQASDCPAWGLDYPSKVVNYKDRYFCFIELDEPPMSVNEMIGQTDYSGNLNMEGGGVEAWILVVSKCGKKKEIIDISFLEPGWITYFNVTELWPYFSGYVEKHSVQMGIMSHDIELNDFSFRHYNADSIKQKIFWDEEQRCTKIKEINGEMYLRNNTDSPVYVASDNMKHYAIVNNHDSLYLSLCDSLPIILEPNEYKIARYKTLPHQDNFFKNTASRKDCWEYLSYLFRNSTYCLMNVNGKDVQEKIMFDDIANCGFVAHCRTGHGISLRILNHGIYDKEGMKASRFRFWSDKWDAMNKAEKERIWNETEENFEKNVERRNRRKWATRNVHKTHTY